MVNIVVVLGLLAFAVSPTTALSKGRTYNADKEKDKQYVTCRLAKRKIVVTQKFVSILGPTKQTIRFSLTNLKTVLAPSSVYMNQIKVYLW